MSAKYQFVFLRNNNALDARQKAPKDVEHILSGMGYAVKYLNLHLDKSRVLRSLLMWWELLIALVKIPQNSQLVVQYPLTDFFYHMRWLLALKRIECTAIIHDLESYRYDGKLSLREIQVLGMFHIL